MNIRLRKELIGLKGNGVEVEHGREESSAEGFS